MIGNDIIDLNLAEKESDWQRDGFLEKQFTKKEQAIIRQSEDPFTTVWTFWSMKEAAYKIWARQANERAFTPLKFECEFSSEDEGIVFFWHQKVYTNTHFNEFLIHTIACFEQEARVHSEIGSPHNIDKRIKKQLHERTGVPVVEIEQRKTYNGAPDYYHKSKKLIKSCSISHHGNYGAFSLLLN